MTIHRLFGILLGALLATAAPAFAQGEMPIGASTDPFMGSAPRATATADTIPLSVKDAVQRALQHNLGLLLQEEAVKDARVYVSQPLVDLRAVNDAGAASAKERAETLGVRTARDLQQQYDAAVASADAARAAADAATSDVAAAQAAVAAAEQRARQARGTAAQANAQLQASRTGPEQLRVTKAQAGVAKARVRQAATALAQAELNLQRTSIKAPSAGTVGRKSVEMGQVITHAMSGATS